MVVLVAGGAASEWTVPTLEATISAMEARSLASISMGASLEEPCITVDVGGVSRGGVSHSIH